MDTSPVLLSPTEANLKKIDEEESSALADGIEEGHFEM
jgi:hypothetical protein